MKHYRYVKMLPVTLTIPVFPVLSVTIGFLLLVWVVWPILSFKFFGILASDHLVTPVSDDFVAQVYAQSDAPVIDSTKVNSWLPYTNKKTITSIESYTISIPKLRINNALARVGSNDLSENLIHYGGTGLPGKYGTAVIFGHSVLPSFYNPKNYLTIFSLLPTLKIGDDIFVHFDGIDYRYKVFDKKIATPDDVSGLEHRYDNSYITLVTCVPPGTYWERLWLSAKRVKFSDQ